MRYQGWTTQDFGRFRTYAYDDARPDRPCSASRCRPGVTGDPAKGRALFLSRRRGRAPAATWCPATTCGRPAASAPTSRRSADRGLPDAYLYQQIHDPRVIFPAT